MSEALKACPFCGWPSGIEFSEVANAVVCPDCFAEGPVEDTEAEAITAWNTRANTRPPIPGTEIERVARAIASARSWQTTPLTVGDWDCRSESEREPFLQLAKAAIESMSSEDEVRRLRAELDHLCASIEAENERGIGVSGTLMSDMREARTALTPNPCGQEES